MRFAASQAATALGATLVGVDAECDGVSFDSRLVLPGQLFVPLVAERDGHDFIAAAIARGASAYLTNGPTVEGATAIKVVDTLNALMRLGQWARARFDGPVVAVTGSVGKTSVKDLIRAALAPVCRVHANERSFNNDFGLPSTILNAPDATEVLVTEMGMRGFGEIARLCSIAAPTIGVVTRVAGAHSERVGGIDGVRRAKAELIEALADSGTAVLNADDDRVASMRSLTAASVVTYGYAGDVRVSELSLDHLARARFTLTTPNESCRIALNVSGEHMAINAAAAAGVAFSLGIDLSAIVEGLEATELSPHRMALGRMRSGAVVIDDSYNANPTSMRAALDALAALPAQGRRIAVLGVMAEISDPSVEHRDIAAYADRLGVELIAVGTDLYGVEPTAEPHTSLMRLTERDAVLVKGSRVAGLDGLAGVLLQQV